MEQNKGTSPSDVRYNNLKTIYMTVYGSGRITKREVQYVTSLSWGTVTTMMDRLESLGFIVRDGKRVTNGRSAVCYSVNRSRGYVVGIDLNLSGATAVSADCYGKAIQCVGAPLVTDSQESVINQITGMTDIVISKTAGSLDGIGIAVQGILDAQHGISESIFQIPEWKNVRLAEIFEKRFGARTYLLHDPDCLNLAESKLGRYSADYTRGNVALIRVDAGVGLSVMINGHMSTNGYSSELGHICVDPGGPRCLCGNVGCLEEYASSGGISRRYASLSGERGVPASEIAERSKEGDRNAEEVINGFCEKLCLAVSSIVNMLPIDTVIFYGELTGILSERDAEISRILSSHIFMHRKVNIRYSDLSRSAAALGASLWATRNILRDLNFHDPEEL